MKTIILATLGLALAAPALAEARTISADGQQFRYDTQFKGGYQVVSGTNLSTGETFILRERKGRVTGYFGDRAVSYRVSPRAAVEVASR